MYKKSGVLTFYSETPVHVGTGQSVSYVDLPIQRERHTSFPVLWSSGIKGVIRDLASRKWPDKEKVELIFGPENEGSEFASCISITDAKILLYPVRSLKGVFAWITCPLVLRRLKDDITSVGLDNDLNISEFLNVTDGKALVFGDDLIVKDKNEVVLEEFAFEARKEKEKELEDFAEFLNGFLPNNELTSKLKEHLVIVSDNVFKDFVNYAVEVRTRIRIDQAKGTVKDGALFSEELIPSESVFYSLVFVGEPFKKDGKLNSANDVFNEVKSLFEGNGLIQLGGDETTGKGYMRVKFYS
jgi:CRISPR-associated protein Cmr4